MDGDMFRREQSFPPPREAPACEQFPPPDDEDSIDPADLDVSDEIITELAAGARGAQLTHFHPEMQDVIDWLSAWRSEVRSTPLPTIAEMTTAFELRSPPERWPAGECDEPSA